MEHRNQSFSLFIIECFLLKNTLKNCIDWIELFALFHYQPLRRLKNLEVVLEQSERMRMVAINIIYE